MEKLNAKQILEIVEKNYTEGAFGEGDWYETKEDFPSGIYQDSDSWNEKQDKILNYLGLGKVVAVDSYGGDGQGETYFVIWHFLEHDVMIRVDGFYTSYEGTTWEEGYGHEVKPVQKLVTVYE